METKEQPLALSGGERITRPLLRIAAAIAFGVFALIAAAGLVMTCSFDQSVYWNEVVLYKIDFIPLNILVLAALAALSLWLFGRPARPSEKTATLVSALAAVFAAAVGIIWVVLVKCEPEFDSYYLTHAASLASQNDFSFIADSGTDYFIRFPFQLSYVTALELAQRVFGADNFVALGILNALFLGGAYLALFDLTKRLFKDTRVRIVTAVAAALFLQGPLFCTFIYGNIPGLCFALWAAALFIRVLKGGRGALLIPAAILLAIAILIKPNYWIFLVAMGIIALLWLLIQKKPQALATVLCAALLASGGSALCQKRYEAKTGVSFGEGTPQTAWLAMGMHGSYMAPGWYNGYTGTIYSDNGFDREKTKAQIAADLKENLSKMKNPVYTAAFFGRKLLSQYEETSFESIFVSKDAQNGRKVPGIVEWVYHDGENLLLGYFDQLMQPVYVFGALAFFGLFAALKKKRSAGLWTRAFAPELPEGQGNGALPLMLLPVILLGGFFYHMIFEGKSQYMLTYIPLLFPYAAYAYVRTGEALRERFKKKTTGKAD